MFLLVLFLLSAMLCGAAGWLLEKAESGLQHLRLLRRAAWPLGAACLMLPFMARSFAFADLAALAGLLPLSAGLLMAVQACFVLRKKCTGKKAGALAAAGIALACLFLELVPFQVNYWASRCYTPVELLISADRGPAYLEDDQCSFTIEWLDVDAHNLYISYTPGESIWYDDLSVQVSCVDSAFESTPITMRTEWQLYRENDASHYYNLNLDGHLTALTLSFPVGSKVIVDSLQANVPRPFRFSLLRLLLLGGVICFFWKLRPSGIAWKTPFLSRNKEQKWFCRAVVGSLAALYILMSAYYPQLANLKIGGFNTYDEVFISWDEDPIGSVACRQYPLLAESLSHGKLALEIEPDPKLIALDNPYDRAARNAAGADVFWDAAYYQGHYYVYFGVVPVLIFYLPYYLLTGKALGTEIVCIITGFLFLAGAVCLLRTMFQMWFPHASIGIYLISLLTATLLSDVPILIGRPDIYEIPILCALMFTVWGFAAWITASRPCSHRRLLLFAGGSSLALVAGCRPQMVLFSIVILPLFGREYLLEKRLLTKDGFKDFIYAMLPYFVVATALMAYNFLRFGSPLDFGATYNLTTLDMTSRRFQPGRILQGLWAYLFCLPRYSPVFPFLTSTFQSFFHGFTSGTAVYGGAYFSRPILLFGLTGCVFSKELRKKRISSLQICLGMAMLLILCIDVEMTDMNLRYSADFMFGLILIVILNLLQAEEKFTNTFSFSIKGFRYGVLALVFFSIANAMLLVGVGDFTWLGKNPQLFFNLRQLIMFWA